MSDAALHPDVIAQSRAVLATHAKSFRFASFFLPPHAADDAAVLYAFCREVDDAVDEAPSRDEARQAGARLEAELAGTLPARPSVASFLALSTRRGIDVRFARDLVLGARSDAEGPVRVANDDELIRYCYRVAGTVGGMMCPLLGVSSSAALPFAVDLGVAMQVTNISRDILEDARNDRLYIPATRLQAAGIDPATAVEHIANGTVDRVALARVVRELLDLADRYYASGDEGMRFIPLRARLAILVASRVYRAIGVRLLRFHHGDALHGRTVVPLRGKLLGALRALGAACSLSLRGARGRDATLLQAGPTRV